jgi:hypothetical protein
MPVYNGQDVSAEITNPAFLDAQDDDTAAGRISFHNTDTASGGNVDNIQRNINSICSALGINANEVYNYLISWANSYVGLSSSDAKSKIEALVNRFLAVGGHTHTAVNGEGPKISAYALAAFNFYSAAWQVKSLTGISGATTDLSTDMALETPNGMSTNLGVITDPPNNRVWILNSSDETFFENATGQRVYGRVTYVFPTWTLSFYTNVSGVETAFTMPVSNIKMYFLKVFDQNTRPSIPEMPGVFGTMDLTSDIMDASPTQRGLVNLLAQSFLGSKTFQSITNVSNTTQSTTSADGALIVSGGIGVAKNLNVGGNAVVTGDLTVNGTTTTINTQTLDVTDSNITVNKNGNDASSEGSGLTVARTGTAGSFIYATAATSKFKCGPLGSEIEIATISGSQSLTNKTLDNTNAVTLLDTNLTLQDNGNVTKQAKFDAALITAGQTRTYSLPDQDGTVALYTDITTFAANKTLSNLTNPTAVNQSLIPGAALDLGTSANPWTTEYVSTIKATATSPFIDMINGLLKNASSVTLADFSGNAIKLTVLAADPGSPIAGQIYFNSVSLKYRSYNGTIWQDLGGVPAGGNVGQLIYNTGSGLGNWFTPKNRVTSLVSAIAVSNFTTKATPVDQLWSCVSWSPELGMFAAASQNGTYTIMTSYDGITWTLRQNATEAGGWLSICWASRLGLFVAVGLGGTNRVYKSTDGITWTTSVASALTATRAICYSNDLNLFVAVGSVGGVMTSPDAVTWTTQTAPNQLWNCVIWCPELGLFVAGDNNSTLSNTNRVMTSPDGITWTSQTTTDCLITALVWSPELKLIIGVGPSYLVSSVLKFSVDGVNWTYSNAIPTNAYTSIAWSPELGEFVIPSAVGGIIYSSTDGVTWTARTSPSSRTWKSICWSPELGVFASTATNGVGDGVMLSAPVKSFYGVKKYSDNFDKIALRDLTTGLVTIKANDVTTSYTIKMPAAQGAALTNLQNDGSGNLSWAASGGGSGSLTYTILAGETLAAGDAVYVSSASDTVGRTLGSAYKLDATNSNRIEFAGIVSIGATAGLSCTIQVGGRISSLSGLTVGQPVYASVSTVGGLQTTVPSTIGQWIIQIGMADTTTSLIMNAGLSSTATQVTSTSNYAVLNVVTQTTATLTLTSANDMVRADGTSNAIAITLPTAVGIVGKVFHIKKVDSSVNAITVNTTSSQTIDGATSKIILTQYQVLSVVSNNANWDII